MNTLHRDITNQIVADFYDQAIMSNLARPHYIERMISRLLRMPSPLPVLTFLA